MKKIIFIFATFFLFQYWSMAESPRVGAIKHDNVVLYTASWCGYCEKTRTFLTEKNIMHTEYDIEKSEEGRKQHEALGGNGVPVLDIKGTVIYGYSVRNMESIFKQLNLM